MQVIIMQITAMFTYVMVLKIRCRDDLITNPFLENTSRVITHKLCCC